MSHKCIPHLTSKSVSWNYYWNYYCPTLSYLCTYQKSTPWSEVFLRIISPPVISNSRSAVLLPEFFPQELTQRQSLQGALSGHHLKNKSVSITLLVEDFIWHLTPYPNWVRVSIDFFSNLQIKEVRELMKMSQITVLFPSRAIFYTPGARPHQPVLWLQWNDSPEPQNLTCTYSPISFKHWKPSLIARLLCLQPTHGRGRGLLWRPLNTPHCCGCSLESQNPPSRTHKFWKISVPFPTVLTAVASTKWYYVIKRWIKPQWPKISICYHCVSKRLLLRLLSQIADRR